MIMLTSIKGDLDNIESTPYTLHPILKPLPPYYICFYTLMATFQ